MPSVSYVNFDCLPGGLTDILCRTDKVGNDETDYTPSSLFPVVRTISPEAYQQMKTAHSWHRAQLIPLWISLVALAIYIGDTDNDTVRSIGYGGSLTSIAISFLHKDDLDQSFKLYNNALKEKLRPGYESATPK